VDLLPSEEQQEIIATAASVLAKEYPISRIRDMRTEPSVVDQRAWSRCAQLGWFGLTVAENDGGVGYALVEEALLFREIGRRVAPGPFLATALGARVAVAGGRPDIAQAIIAGDALVGLAQARHLGASIGREVSGSFDLFDAVGAPYVLAVGPAGAALVATDDVGPIEPVGCIDPGVRLAQADVSGVVAVASTGAEFEPTFLRGSVLAAAMLVGISEATRDMAAEYAKVRVQFGKPIGVHQAIKHRCADMAMRAAAADSLLLFAALSVDAARPDAAFQAAAAKVVATDAGIRNAGENIQVHGGMGYTYEHDAHLYLKRAHVLDRVIGSSRDHLARLVDLPPAQ
jgi:alkylation response protein AidB-like acyl-CoA dehydrogenase